MADYRSKRSFEETPEPPPKIEGNVDPATAPPGDSFVIHQHHARRLHFDLRLEMRNGDVSVLVSWAVPKNLPLAKGKPRLAVHVEDHPFEYGSFSGSIPAGNYGAGEVRIFDSGNYEMLERSPGKISFRLDGKRLQGSWTMSRRGRDGKDEWLTFLKEDRRPPADPFPELQPMTAGGTRKAFDNKDWIFEPVLAGERCFAVCRDDTQLLFDGTDITSKHESLAEICDWTVAIDAILDGCIIGAGTSEVFIAFDLLYLDGKSMVDVPLSERKRLLEETVVKTKTIQPIYSVAESGIALARASEAQGMKVIAKRGASQYVPGRSSKDWQLIA